MTKVTAMLMLLLASGAGAQSLPHTVQDPNVMENLEFLASQARQNKAGINTINAGADTQNDPQVFNSSVTFNGGVWANATSSFTGAAQFNSSATFTGRMIGSQVIAAWAVFVGTDTPATLMRSVNVTSVTHSATGTYQVNFTTAMPGNYFSSVCTASMDGGGVVQICMQGVEEDTSGASVTLKTFNFNGPISNAPKVNVIVVAKP